MLFFSKRRIRFRSLFDKTGLLFVALFFLSSIFLLSRNGKAVLNYFSYRGITTYYMACLYIQVSALHSEWATYRVCPGPFDTNQVAGSWTKDPQTRRCDHVALSSARDLSTTSLSSLECEHLPCQVAYMTFSTSCSPNLNKLARAARDSNMDFALLGLDSFWTGWGGRMRAYARYIESLPASTIVIASDASDVLLLPSCQADDIVTEFTKLDTPILFTAEKACFPDRNLEPKYPTSLNDSPYKYLNAGAFIGYAWAVQLLFEAAYTCDCSDDQRAYTDMFLKQCSYVRPTDPDPDPEQQTRLLCREKLQDIHRLPTPYGPILNDLYKANESFPLIKLDYENRIFQSLYDTPIHTFDFVELDNSLPDEQRAYTYRLENRLTGGRPCIFHQNGPKSDQTVLKEIQNRLEI